jgi:hypothetical protein
MSCPLHKIVTLKISLDVRRAADITHILERAIFKECSVDCTSLSLDLGINYVDIIWDLEAEVIDFMYNKDYE